MTEVGVEPTKSPDSESGRFSSLRTRPITALRLRAVLQAPVTIRASRPYEDQSGTCPACHCFADHRSRSVTDTGGIRTHTHEGLSFIAIPRFAYRAADGSDLGPLLDGRGATAGWIPGLREVTRAPAILTNRSCSQLLTKEEQQPTSVARVGLEPTASLVLSQGGLPLPTKPVSAVWPQR